MIYKFILVFIGGGLGAICRYSISIFGERLIRNSLQINYPISTFSVNVIGSFVIGILFAIFEQNVTANETMKLFWIVGVLGGFTTFSSFSLDTYQLIVAGNYMLSGLYVFSSVAISIVFTFLGFYISNFF